jgi:hypothetical protein
VLEEDMHRLPERVIEDFDDLLVDERISRRHVHRVRGANAGEREGHRAATIRDVECRCDRRVAARRPEAHHHVFGSDERGGPELEVK